jgi:putative endopeptidase
MKPILMYNRLWIFLTVLLFSACQTPEKKQAPDFLREDIDSTVSPATDFFSYANGGWLKKNQIPIDQSQWSIGSLVQLDIYNRLKTINENAVEDSGTSDGITRKIGNFWFSGMDSVDIENQGLLPLKPKLAEIEKIADLKDFLRVNAQLSKIGVDALMGEGVSQDSKHSDQMALYIWQGGLGMPNREYYFNTDKRSLEIKNAYRQYLFRSFLSLGKDSAGAVKAAGEVLQFEYQLAKVSRKLEDLRDPDSNYHKMSLGFLQKKYRNINWADYLENSGIPGLDSVIVGQPEFLSGVDQEIAKTPLPVLKNYLAFHLLDNSASYLNLSIFMDRFNYTRLLSGVKIPKPRWKRILDDEENTMGEALGHLFVNEYFSQTAKDRYNKIVEAMRDAYRERIMRLDWMNDSTKQKALIKLAKITKKVGYPDKWRDFSSLVIDRGPYLLNVQRAMEWWNNEQIRKLGKPVDRTEWDITPQTYNAYYNPSNNEIVVPAAQFMVPRKRDEDLDDAFVYGYTAASTIGHEMTHGFDDQGRKFDDAGNLHDWWQAQDAKHFKQSARKIVIQFNEFSPVDTLHINGDATQGENIADLGGLVIGWDAFIKTDAYKNGVKIGGFTPAQRFFLGYAYSFASSQREEQLANELLTDVHAPAKERVNGPLSNMPVFYDVFGVKPGDKMYRTDSLRVNIW